ncbi:MAG TPA: hypothetical protein VGU73_06040, partial [Acidimicrobiia bacterium]|nr:hypothetical protein [Acidimicrobiia bacterium]
ALTYARNPEGIIEAAKRKQLTAIQRALDHRARRAEPDALPEPSDEAPVLAPPAAATAAPKRMSS